MFDVIINALSLVFVWFGKIFVVIFQATWDIIVDLIIAALDLFLSVTGALISLASVPQFLTQYSLQSLIGQTGSNVLYFVSVFNILQGLAMLGVGVVFRPLACKLFMLGQR